MINQKFFKIVGIFFIFSVVLNSKINYQETILQANELYKKGDFQAAYELYKKIPDPSAQVNYNLGNCAYKLKNYGCALLYWRRAENELGFLNKTEVLDNIALLKKHLSSQQSSQHFVSNLKNNLIFIIRNVPLIVIQFLFLIVWIFLFIYIRYLYKKRHKILITFLFIIIATLGALLVIKYNLENKIYGVVVSQKAILFSGPSKNFPILGSISQASEVEIQKSSDGFYKIKFNKAFGWVSKKDVGKI
ncbi:SH3 domain-containing protein [Candidatus Dependentiae bacterium]|nr:SH3 domain-containing protein [Candidatus Dependentiae bacterium]